MFDIATITLITILLALVFDFINGFHDASNSIATIVASRVLKHWQAVIWAAVFNFAAFFFISTGVAKTVGSGLMDLQYVTSYAIIAGLIGGIIWNLWTWWRGIPASSSHTLIGAYAGAVCAHIVFNTDANMLDAFVSSGWIKVLAFIIIAPAVGFALAFVVMSINYTLDKIWKPDSERLAFYKGAQLCSSALLSFMHGGNDAQKTAGIIAGALFAGGYMAGQDFHIPDWVLLLAYLFIALGTLAGGWRITKTVGFSLTKIKPRHGFAAETGAALSIGLATWLHMPISTTLATTGSVVGVGAARGPATDVRPDDRTVNWQLFRKIFYIWLVTLPASFALGAAAFWIINQFI
ncbi:MAG: anion permease [Bdellovibrionales bacterium]